MKQSSQYRFFRLSLIALGRNRQSLSWRAQGAPCLAVSGQDLNFFEEKRRRRKVISVNWNGAVVQQMNRRFCDGNAAGQPITHV